MMRTVPNVVSLHEPPPAFHETSDMTRDEKMGWLKDVKLPYIYGLAQDVYFESSSQFVRLWPALFYELGVIPDAVVVRRSHRDVALSMWRMGYIPARSDVSKKYGIKPEDDDSIFYQKDYSHWTDYQLCYWHCLEVELRTEKYMGLLSNNGALVYVISFESLVTKDGFMSMLEGLNLPEPDMQRFNDLWGIEFNKTKPDRANLWPHGDIDAQERMFHELL